MAKQKTGEKKAVATDFESIISKSRERQRAQTLAQKLLGKESRRKSTGVNEPAGSLALRAGIKKRASTSALPSQPKDLASRIAVPGSRKAKKIAATLQQIEATAQQQALASAPKGPKGTKRRNNQENAFSNINPKAFPTPPAAGGMSIRGLAGPFVVAAENFANGTTAADIESAVAPVGGIVQSCRIMRTQPIVKAEITFESREGAERVISFFDGKTADSRVLRFYPKVRESNMESSISYPQAQPRQSASQIVDGSHGFDDPMEVDGATGSKKTSSSASGVGGLYSDRMIPPSGPSAQRKGRFNAWRGRGGANANSRSRDN